MIRLIFHTGLKVDSTRPSPFESLDPLSLICILINQPFSLFEHHLGRDRLFPIGTLGETTIGRGFPLFGYCSLAFPRWLCSLGPSSPSLLWFSTLVQHALIQSSCHRADCVSPTLTRDVLVSSTDSTHRGRPLIQDLDLG